MKYLISLLALMVLTSLPSGAQTPAPAASVWDDPAILFYVVIGFLVIVSLLVLVVAVFMLRVVNIVAEKAAMEKAEKEGVVYKPEPSLLTSVWDKLNGYVPVEKEATIVLDHNYDGIRELDNHLPPWWKWLFYVTIAWSAVYLLSYHVFNSLPLSINEYDNEVAYANEQQRKMKAANPGPQIDETNVAFTDDAKFLADGKSTFLNTCASCHRRDGGGDIGPNLTDEYWKHGGSIANIFKVVKEGVQGTNMVAWGGVMSPEAMRNVSSYVMTLQGSNPPNPKKPEGDLYKPEKKEVKSDSVKTQASL